MAFNFEEYASQGKAFLRELAANLGHPADEQTTARILRAVLHTFRDRITMSESLDVLAQLPMFLKSVYVEQWKYRETPLKLRSMEDFKEAVKAEQNRLGERQFNWPESTEEIVKTTFLSLKKYLTEGEATHVLSQMPKEIQEIFDFQQANH